MHMRSTDFVRNRRCAAFSAIQRRASSPLYDAQKNSLRLLWSNAHGLVRPAIIVESETNVYPMIPAGATYRDTILSDAQLELSMSESQGANI